ncbi:O-antigen translocase [Flavicella sp.]|uniref:O-antigen translocase n=1 Tax=Flavicella sp. TaxID=2957742 RepID=UPI0030163E02
MLNFIKKNQFIKVLGYNSIATVVKFISGFVSLKLVAHFLGTEGMVLLGNFKNFNSSLKTFSTFGFDGGITKLISEHKNDTDKTNKIISTSFISRLVIAITLSILLIVFASYINIELFKNHNFNYLLYALAISLPFYSLNSLFISIINGFQEFKHLISCNIITSLFGLILSTLLIYYHFLPGAILAIIIIESLSILITYYFYRKSKINVTIKSISFSYPDLKILLQFSIMTLTSALIAPASNFLIRNEISELINIDSAGYWEALNRISNYYMLIITSISTIYYFPKFSSSRSYYSLKNEFSTFFKILLPLFIVLAICIYFLRKYVVLIALNEDFLPVTNFFLWYLIGDVFNVASLAFGYLIMARTMTKTYIFTEVSFYIIYVLLAHILLKKIGLNGVIIGYAISNFIYLVMMLIIFRKFIFLKKINLESNHNNDYT